MFERCLVCTDLTDGLYRLVDFIPSLAATGLKQVTFLHTAPFIDDGGVPREDESALARARSILKAGQDLAGVAGIVVDVEVLSGRPQDTIPRTARERQVDVILIGTPTRSLLEERLFGSTCMELTQGAIAPITLLRPQLVSTYTTEELNLRCRHLWQYLLLPYDGSSAAKSLIERVKAQARNRSENFCQKCLLCSVVDDAGRRGIPLEPQMQAAREQLELVRQELEAVGIEVICEVRQGDLLQEILDVALAYDITAIAVVAERRNVFIRWAAPTLSGALLRSSWHPVLFFPHPNPSS